MIGQKLLLILPLTVALSGQSLRVYSEFQRIDPFGRIVAADQGAPSREILSPAVGRNGYASYRVVVQAPPQVRFNLFVAQNPKDTVTAKLYRERYIKLAQGWVPDKLDPVSLPYAGSVADPDLPIPEQTVQSFWLDLYVPPEARIGRFRLEVQLNIGERWVIYPLEIRVQPSIYPAKKLNYSVSAPPEAPADSPALGVLQQYLCESAGAGGKDEEMTARSLIRRNALQDMALADVQARSLTRPVVAQQLFSLAGTSAASLKDWCAAAPVAPGGGPEWYLRIRDYLLMGKASR